LAGAVRLGLISRPHVAVFGALLLLAVPLRAATCPGDCDGNLVVSIGELVVGVSVALGQAQLASCPMLDGNGDDTVSVDELVAAVAAGLQGCPATPTATASITPTITPTATASATPTPTATPNHPPQITPLPYYLTYPGESVALPIPVVDPDGGTVQCSADQLPDGAALDANVLRWTPTEDQLGPYYVPITCSDSAVPPASSDGLLVFKVEPPDSCVTPVCDPASGCDPQLPPLTETCCTGPPTVRVSEPQAPCPQGRWIRIGGNRSSGFGELSDCDLFRVFNQAQSGASVQFQVQVACLNSLNRVNITARMETANRRPMATAELNTFLTQQADGSYRPIQVVTAVNGPTPFFDIQDSEANLTVTATDFDGTSVSETVRLLLTFTPILDLPTPTATPGAP
jgi:Putative Ig domain